MEIPGFFWFLLGLALLSLAMGISNKGTLAAWEIEQLTKAAETSCPEGLKSFEIDEHSNPVYSCK